MIEFNLRTQGTISKFYTTEFNSLNKLYLRFVVLLLHTLMNNKDLRKIT